MGRRMAMASLGLSAALALLSSGCGGGGGGGSSSGGSSQVAQSPTPIPTLMPGEPTLTPTPLRAVASGNERTQSSDAGSITLRLQSIDLFVGGKPADARTAFSVFLVDRDGHPLSNRQIQIDTNLAVEPPLTPGPGDGTIFGVTGADGALSGTLVAVAPGRGFLTVTVVEPGSVLDGLSVTLGISVHLVAAVTPTSVGPSTTPVPTETPTPLPCQDVQTIIVQTDTFNMSSQTGGNAEITAVIYDSNNVGVPRTNVLFDISPRIATFDPQVQATNESGIATTTLTVPANSSFGVLTVSASACGITGTVDINVVSGVSTKPVTTVVLQADPSTVGNLSGGTINLTAAVFDSDNAPINGIDVLFVSPVGRVNPLADRTKVTGSQSGIASSVLQVPIGTPEGKLQVNAIAGGVTGSTTVTVVAGRVPPGSINPGVPPGEPAAITLGASPTHMQVAGTGGTELSTVIGRVFDNNGNPLSGVAVRYHVVTAQSAPGAAILPVTTPVPEGSPTPTPSTLCPTDDPVSISDVAGFAVIQVHAGPQPGPVTVAACADTTVNGVPAPVIEQQTVVTVSSGPASHIGISISPQSSTNNDGTLLTMLSASITDAQGNPVEDGTAAFFQVVPRAADDPAQNVIVSGNSLTDAEPPCDTAQYATQTGVPISPQPGNAIVCVKYPVAQQGMEIQVRVTVGTVTNSINGQAVTLPGAVGDLEAQVVPSTVQVGNTNDAFAVVHVSVFDSNLNPVQNVRVRFATSVGSIDRSVLTDSDGEASATLTIPAGTASGTAIVRVAGGGLQITSIAVPILNTSGGGTTPTPGGTAQPGSIHFVGAQPATIGVRGSGLPEQSILTFQVTDTTGNPLGGVPVNFFIARIADEQIAPSQAVSDGDGNVQVTLTSGERAMSIQVTAQVSTVSPALTVRSTAVNILGGPPSQPNFSLAHQFHNISGAVTFGLQDKITAFVADRFGNPVPPGTAVNFTTKSGAIGNQTTTNEIGQATATLISQQPLSSTGIVATLATTVGERPFRDSNGNGVCDPQDELQPVSEPFYDTNCNGRHDTGEDFIDLNGDGQFNADQGTGSPACTDQLVLFQNICTTFSGPTNALLTSSGSGPLPAGGARDFTLVVSDNPDMLGNPGVGNPIVGGSTINVSVSGGRARIVGTTSITLPDVQTFDQITEVNRFPFSVVDANPSATTDETDVVVVTIKSDPGSLPAGGNGSLTLQSALTFLAAPTPTSTPTAPPAVTPTPTPSPALPLVVPTQTTLSVGTGAPPSTCNGGTQTFVVTGGSPPFMVSGGGGCTSTSSLPTSGGAFVFTAGNTTGSFSIIVTDALGRTNSVGVTIQGPLTPTVPPTQTAVPAGSTTATPTVTATPPPGSIQFLGATPAAIGVRGSGLPEQSTLTFRVNSVTGNPIPGVAVQFALSGTGSESLNPLAAVSDQNGLVSTAVTSGTQATSVRVIATLVTLPGVSAQSTAVSILGAPPAFNHFSMAAQQLNVAGRVTFGLTDTISAFVNDRFGNAVPPGTAVSFITNAASVVSPTTTDASGVATATLLTEGLVPPSGIVTVMAYTHGEETFLDNNGNGIFDAGDTVLTDDIPEPFVDFRPLPPADAGCSVLAPSSRCNNRFDPNTQFELFVDTNGNGVWDSVGTTGIGQGTHGAWDNNILVFDTVPITLSGHLVTPVAAPASFNIAPGGAQAFTLEVHDDVLNPIVGGSTIAVSATVGTIAGASITVPDGESFNRIVDGLTRFSFVLSDSGGGTGDRPLVSTSITVTVTSPNGSGTFVVASGLIPGAATSSTPTPTP